MKRIIITNDGWLDRNSKRHLSTYDGLAKLIFSLAAQNGYEISVEGQKWPR